MTRWRSENLRPVTVSRRTDLLSLATFVALGLPDGMLGTVWPSMRATLAVPVGDLGLIQLAYTAGAVTVSAFVGRIIHRAGVGRLLALSATVAAAAAAAFFAAPVFAVVAAAGVAFGLAGGMMDGGLNVAVATSGRGRLLNLLHGFYGVGTMIGPLVVTAAILAGSWQAAYLVLLAVDAAVALLWLGPAASGRDRPAPAGREPGCSPAQADTAPATKSARPRQRAVAVGMGVFFVYTGLEVAAGQWETTFARDHLHYSTAAAGLATFGYWAALTTVRLVLGLLPKPPRQQTVIGAGSGLALVAAGGIWWQPSAPVAVAGFVVLGAALAGVFPALVALTPARVGGEAAARLIAWQIGAATAGGAALSALMGLLVQRSGLSVVGPALTVLAAVLVCGQALLRPRRLNIRSI